MIDTILFDFDGTIMDTNEIIIDSWQATFRELSGKEADRDVLLKTFGEPLEATMLGFFPDVPLEESLEIYRGYQREYFIPSIRLFPGVLELLDALSREKVNMALVTSRLKFTTDQALEHFDIGKYFDYVITADEVNRHKPDPLCAQLALDALNAQPEQAIMLGDSPLDIMCARNAGVSPVLVSWSMTMADRIGSFSEAMLPGESYPEATARMKATARMRATARTRAAARMKEADAASRKETSGIILPGFAPEETPDVIIDDPMQVLELL